MVRHCCAECFSDRGLRRSIIPRLSLVTGECDYCHTDNVSLVEPIALQEYFELLVGAYRISEQGESLVVWFRRDWGLFEHHKINDGTAQSLLTEILDDGNLVRNAFIPLQRAHADRLGQWELLRTELMNQNRFFPRSNIDLERLEQLLSFLALGPEELPELWSRARIEANGALYDVSKMGAPPGRVASNGRANPAGIPYLYLASNASTAISEVRPESGDDVDVAEFTLPANPKIIDLRNPTRMASPFLLEDADDVLSLRSDLPWLEKLGLELTRPVLSHSAAIDYTPSQYLCEYIKRCGYDGVLYKSSVGSGFNLAFFFPEKPQGGSVTRHHVDRVEVTSTQVGP